jgi:hypothetical protein
MRTDERHMPLDRFPVIRTRNVDQMREAVASIYGDVRMELQGGAKDINVWGNHCPARNVGISYCTYETPIHLEFSGVDFFAEQFLIRGSAEVTIDGVRTKVTTQRASVISPGVQVSLDYSSDFAQLVLRVEPKALTSKLAHLMGAHPAHPLKFSPTANLDRPETQSLKQMLLFLVPQFDMAEFNLPPLAMAEFEQALMVTFLCANRHNYSHLLDEQPSGVAPWQVRRAEQYIEAH